MSEHIDRRWTVQWGHAMKLEAWAEHDTQRAYNGDTAWEDAALAWNAAALAWNDCMRVLPRDKQDKRDAAYVHQDTCDAMRDHMLRMMAQRESVEIGGWS